MKYFCLAEKDQEASMFLFPRELDDKSIEEHMVGGLRNQTFGYWRRFQFDVISNGNISFIGNHSNKPDPILYEMTDSSYYSLFSKQINTYPGMKYICVLGNEGKEYIYLFPNYVHHDAMEEVIAHLSHVMDSCRYEDILSAGFVNSDLKCFGKSETLGTVSRMDTDTKILHKQLIANKGYYDGCKLIDQEVDGEIYIHIEKVKGTPYLTVQRGE